MLHTPLKLSRAKRSVREAKRRDINKEWDFLIKAFRSPPPPFPIPKEFIFQRKIHFDEKKSGTQTPASTLKRKRGAIGKVGAGKGQQNQAGEEARAKSHKLNEGNFTSARYDIILQ
eukprot:1394150-Amorphochlora_amoeboformis.AAC.1